MRRSSNPSPLSLLIGDTTLAICRLGPRDPIPSWATQGDFISITRTTDELSIVCGASSVPEGIRSERDWRSLRVAGTIDFSVVGVLASLADPLSEAGISLFVISTFDTDYVLVKDQDLDRAIDVLKECGHGVTGIPTTRLTPNLE